MSDSLKMLLNSLLFHMKESVNLYWKINTAKPTEKVDAKLKDGKLATKFQEHQSTIKCMLNIAEDTLPELDDYVGCCGFWALHDFLIRKVEKDCNQTNLDQVKGMSAIIAPRVREHCAAYPQGSFTCRLLIIMPVTFAVLFIIFFVAINVCACVMFCKWRSARTKYQKARSTSPISSRQSSNRSRNNKNFNLPSEIDQPLRGSKAANNA